MVVVSVSVCVCARMYRMGIRCVDISGSDVGQSVLD